MCAAHVASADPLPSSSVSPGREKKREKEHIIYQRHAKNKKQK
jgi:hypothetical protein